MARRELPYALLDVFTERPFSGNQLAVFAQAATDDATMQHIARELNLSETVFVDRTDDAVASLRIFTPYHEMRFAGHPTIGAAVAIVNDLHWVADDVDRFDLRLKVGLVPIRLERKGPLMAWLTTPPVRFGQEFDRAGAAAMAGLAAADVRDDLPAGLAGADVPFVYVPVTGPDTVDRSSAVAAELRARAGWEEINGLYVYALTPQGVYARMFAPMSGITEDPATGGAAGPLAALLERRGALPAERFVIRQGVAMGRESNLHLTVGRDAAGAPSFEVGGTAVAAGRGAIFLEE
ncbi:MAG TPA: PhzF family phenazine biosynthesis protein [Candidatus Tumulicola sp.]